MDNDAKMTKSLKDKLEKKMGASAMDINIEYQNGFVHLSGFVDVMAEKAFAEEIIKNTARTIKLENNITICMDGQITDRHITAEIDKKLKNSKFTNNLSKITPKVSGGSATLLGSVNTLADELHAIELAKEARGVKSVVSNLDIVSARRYTDPTIKNRINQVFSNRPDIKTSVESGTVTLKGFVKDQNDMETALELAADVEGVIHIQNKLNIRKK